MGEPLGRIKDEELVLRGEDKPAKTADLELNTDKVPAFSSLTWRQQVALKAFFAPGYKSIREIMHENGLHIDSWFKWQNNPKFKKVFKHLAEMQQGLLEVEIGRRLTDRVEAGYLPDRELVKMYEILENKKERQAKTQVNINTGGGTANIGVMSEQQINEELANLGIDPATAAEIVDVDFTEEEEEG
jgi:hypothetical protein